MAPTRPHLPPLSTPKSMTFPSELRERTYTCLDSAKPVDASKKSEDIEMAITPPSAYTEFLNTFSPIFASPTSSRANFSKYMLDKPRPSPTSAPPSAVNFPSYRCHGRSHCHRRSSSNGSGNGASIKHTSTVLPTPSPRCLKSPSKSPDHIRRLRLPPLQAQQGPGHLYTPVTPSPLSAASAHPYHHRPSPRPSHPHPHPYAYSQSQSQSPSDWRFRQLETPAPDGPFNLRQVVTTTVTFRVAPRLAAPPAGKRKRAGCRKNF
ncbi:hypothetical protein ASPSYDRAFT_1136462 [Aspergillus sydowii CBS 593.65]|uniref:Uncharacterized protein n=1 Tax=Aspergillus sydowii CBS 593.65 TaxID=1036612 RepID=A0A1L9TAI4_9EURO|nr:uncharacterized protein ASPSYDRAFT_1136462 [Aspergillus sydowii CBS 593.65]OJJ56375.1 hypothetical protein ASPSYDRAFT_1136462 [Aspergillus sydowii CBS 593.65]